VTARRRRASPEDGTRLTAAMIHRRAFYRAHVRVETAVRKGTLIRSLACEKCGDVPSKTKDGRAAIQGHHHRGYEYPLDVQWLCASCHTKIHSYQLGKRIALGVTPMPGTIFISRRAAIGDVLNVHGFAKRSAHYGGGMIVRRRREEDKIQRAIVQH
jgi:hypothetical protein